MGGGVAARVEVVDSNRPGGGKEQTGTRMHSSRMRTAHSLPYRGVSLSGPPPDRDPPGQTNTCENITFTNFVCGW